jgi:hypothetical protein
MTLRMANRVLKEIGESGSGVSGAELVVANRLLAYKRARNSGDVSGMLEAAKAVAKIGEEHTLTREGDELVDEVVDDALEYAEKVAVGFDDEAEDEGGDGRDFFGRRVRPLDEAGDDLEEDGDEGGDGRDMYGRRVRPLDEGGDGQDEDDEEDDDRRDMYGRRI